MEIKSISQRIFKTSPNKIENAGAHTNPFGVSFKGNIISADVFEKADNKSKPAFGSNLAARVGERSRLAMSAVVGSINSVNEAFGARIDSIVKFGRRIRENSRKTWEALNNIKIEDGIKKAGNWINTNYLKISLDIVNKNDVPVLEKMFEEVVGLKEAMAV